MIKRRQFLLYGLGIASLTVLPGYTVSSPNRNTTDLDQPGQTLSGFSKALFTGLLNTWFYVYDSINKREVPLELVDVNDGGHKSSVVEQFSIVLRGPVDLKLPSDTYWVDQTEIGRFQLHIQEAHNDSLGEYYSAHFSLKR
jgi:hypothetical protein